MTTKHSKDYSDSLERELLGGPITFGMGVEALRIRDEYTQAEFARKLKVSKQYLYDVEKGRKLVSVQQAAKFAKGFGHPPTVLVQLAIQDDI